MSVGTLSAKAHAFSVDELLKRKERHISLDLQEEEPTVSRSNENICHSVGEGTSCHHPNVIEILDGSGNAVKIELCQSELWQAFHRLGTEMIITKTGRRMFPAVRVRISGLKKSAKYRMSIDFLPVDKNKYRYVYHSSRWMISGVGDTMRANQLYEHPESPMNGDTTSSQVISFEKIKLTNHEKPSHGQISLLSMQKFQPRLIIEELEASDISPEHQMTVTFPQTSFIAVTAYQNQEITRLKIARNPFAKGFREAGKCRSSLEAMMASFGVVLDQSHESITNPGKRRFDQEQNLDMKECTLPVKQAMWTHPLFIDQRLPAPLLMYPHLFFHPAVHHTKSTNMPSNNDKFSVKEIVNVETDSDILNSSMKKNIHRNEHGTSEQSVAVSSSSLSNPLTPTSLPQRSSLPIVYQTSLDIHPAFPQCSGFQPSDLHAFASHYKSFVQNSHYPNIVPVLLPSTSMPISFNAQSELAIKRDKTAGDEHT